MRWTVRENLGLRSSDKGRKSDDYVLKWRFRVSAESLLVGKEIKKEKKIPLIGLSPNSDPEALRPLSKGNPRDS